MSAATNFNPTVYAGLLAKFLPKPIGSERELEAATALLLELDERENLSLEEEALAEVLTVLIELRRQTLHTAGRSSQRIAQSTHGGSRSEAQGYLASSRQQGRRDRDSQRTTFDQQVASQETRRLLPRPH